MREPESVAARALQELKISQDTVREHVIQIVGRGQQPPSGHVPFTPRAKKVLELSLREALQLSHNYIGTEHILLGLIREGEGVAAQVLVKLGGNLAVVREKVIEIIPAAAEKLFAGHQSRMRIQGLAHGPNADDQRIGSFQWLNVAQSFAGLLHELDLLLVGFRLLNVGPKRRRHGNPGRLVHTGQSRRD